MQWWFFAALIHIISIYTCSLVDNLLSIQNPNNLLQALDLETLRNCKTVVQRIKCDRLSPHCYY